MTDLPTVNLGRGRRGNNGGNSSIRHPWVMPPSGENRLTLASCGCAARIARTIYKSSQKKRLTGRDVLKEKGGRIRKGKKTKKKKAIGRRVGQERGISVLLKTTGTRRM